MKKDGMTKNTGITLIALVVTIVILLILATVTINITFSEDGLITKAQEAQEAQAIAVLKDRIGIIETAWATDKILNDDITLDDFFQDLVDNGIINSTEEPDVVGPDDNGNYQITTDDGFVFDIIVDENGNITIDYAGSGDELAPNLASIRILEKTTYSVTVQAIASRAENATYTFSYKLSTEDDSAYQVVKNQSSENTCEFTNLVTNQTYHIKVVVENDVGSSEKVISHKVGELASGTITKVAEPIWSNGTATLKLQTSEQGVTIQYQIGTIDGTWLAYNEQTGITGLVHGQRVYARIFDGVNGSAESSIDIIDDIEPTVQVTQGAVSTNSITVTVNATDAQSGMPASPTYNYYIKESTTGSYPTSPTHTGNQTTQTFTGLTQGVSYDIRVTVADNAGKMGTGTLQGVTTGSIDNAEGDLTEGAIIASSPTWDSNSHTASITLSKGSGVARNLSIQWQINGIDAGGWTTGESVTGISHNDTVYARLTDGTNHGQEGSVTIKDGQVPQAATITPSATSTETGTAITATVTHRDNESGVNVASSRWVYNTTAGNIGINAGSYTGGTFSQNPQTISLNASTEGTYYLHVLTVDNAGNARETISSAITVQKPAVADGSFNSSKGVNTPDLADGLLTPIKWNGSSWVVTTADDDSWYNYSTSSKQWANARTSDGSMWVWIPRYAYQISSGYHTNSSSGGTINIKFMQGTSNTAADGTTSWNNASGSGNWNIHPAFNYNGTKAGIWVAKFEASRSNATSSSAGSGSTMKIQPGVQSWRSISVNDIFNTCKNYNSSLNSHMMKNSEWGAVAYLSRSSYGKNGEIWINNSSSYITGSAGNSASASSNTGTTNDYTSTQGVNASTTGTVYGIYDMSGGAYEYVAAYVNNGNSNLNTYGSSLVNETRSYMKDVYDMGSGDTRGANYAANSDVYGDAVYETSSSASSPYTNSWHGDYSNFPYSGNPFFFRGGFFSRGSNAGAFYFNYSAGSAGSYYSFRPVLVSP